MDIIELKKIAKRIRLSTMQMLEKAGTGHPGGALSMVEILVTLYFEKMNIKPHEPNWKYRDRLILSKGHGNPSYYAVLSEKGYFAKEKLSTLRQYGSILQGHPDMNTTPGVDMSTGSLGQGLSIGCGMAIAAHMQHEKFRVYVIVGDGELDEGQNWEALMSAVKYKLDNLTLIVDYNKLQINGSNEDVMGIAPLDKKFAAFNWNVIRINGHDFRDIRNALEMACSTSGRPTVIIADTIKGKGISFMENNPIWHGKIPDRVQFEKIFRELEGDI
ncbi:transketolase [Pectinatus cerevisiiphilus]|uniref:Transketolase n=1 Tax=Pectinatus cerevisiiphilus TaxID=86956 RepID=A0A4R3KAM3_9FIRM|nr:transketolase [Pectinatus cerevisiiphilus]TCS79959.1 transketolase [Pectinatus cerevisiiphilus]